MHIVRYVTGLGGMLTFMLTCVTCTSYVSSLGWGGADVNVHVNLRHMHILRFVIGWGVRMLTFMLTCVTCTSDVTSLGWGVGMLTLMLTCVTAMWRLSKSAIPCSLSTRSNGHVNPKLMRSKNHFKFPGNLSLFGGMNQ